MVGSSWFWQRIWNRPSRPLVSAQSQGQITRMLKFRRSILLLPVLNPALHLIRIGNQLIWPDWITITSIHLKRVSILARFQQEIPKESKEIQSWIKLQRSPLTCLALTESTPAQKCKIRIQSPVEMIATLMRYQWAQQPRMLGIWWRISIRRRWCRTASAVTQRPPRHPRSTLMLSAQRMKSAHRPKWASKR